MRCFVAINISDAVKLRIGEQQQKLQRIEKGVRWIPPASQHLTLKFLGEVSSDAVNRIAEAAGKVACDTPKFEICICRLGAFPSLHRPRVLWVGIQEKEHHLSSLAERLDKMLIPLGFQPEERAWNPHITIGRVKDGFSLKGIIDYITIESLLFDAGSFAADDMVLYQSVLRPEGALYTPLRRFKFGGKPESNAVA